MNGSAVRLSHKTIGAKSVYPPIVIMHGLFGNKRNWIQIAKQLHENTKRQIITLDLRNHGDSPHTKFNTYENMSTDLKLFLKEQSIDKCVLLGHSMGGRVAMATCLESPHLIENLIVVDVSPRESPNTMIAKNAFDAMMQLNLDDVTDRIAAGSLLSNYISDVSLRNFLITNLTFKDNKWCWRINLPGLYASRHYLLSLPDKYFQLKFLKPTLFLRGAISEYLVDKSLNDVYKLFPHTSVITIPDAGHWPHIDKPQLFLEAVQNFLSLK